MRFLAPTIDRLRQRTTNAWLWTLVASIALFTLTAASVNALMPAGRATTMADLGHDFLAFYSAGTIVNSGRLHDLYDLDAVQRLQRAIADVAGITNVAPPVAPWWNPPHVALLFAPLARLGFYPALAIWSVVGVACLACAGWILAGMVRELPDVRRRVWLLVPAMLLAAPATLQALGHGQNTLLSLLLLTLTVAAWRQRRPIFAGIACSLLFYKPQLGAILAVAIVGTLGWRVLVGLMIGLVPQMLAALTLLPGTLAAFLTQVPGNLHRIQVEQPYLWHRHVTLNGFWRFALQGNAPGATHLAIALLSIVSVMAVAAVLVLAWWRIRPLLEEDDVAFDRFVATTVLSTPLLMPFFFDYDLLLMTVAATLVGREMLTCIDASRSARILRTTACIAFAWTMINPAMAELFGINLTVPLLVTIFACQAQRCIAYASAATVMDAAGESNDADADEIDQPERLAA